MPLKRGSRVDNRTGARERGYDRKWEKASSEFKWRNPFCLGCLAIGLKRRATVVDHVIPHKGDLGLFWAPRNWQSSCQWHHNSIKPELERRFSRGEIFAKDLSLASEIAVKLTKEKHRPAVGLDGFAIPGS